MSRRIITVGMDVHQESIPLAVLPDDAPTPTRIDRLPNDLAITPSVLRQLAEQGELRVCYEASGAGYVLQRAMHEWGYACDVIAPSLIPTKPGVQRKHDKHDATQLARLHRAGERIAVLLAAHNNSCGERAQRARRFRQVRRQQQPLVSPLAFNS